MQCILFILNLNQEYCEQDLASLLDNMTNNFTEAQVNKNLINRIERTLFIDLDF